MDRLAAKSSESEPGIKELSNNQLVEDDSIDQVDENRNHKSQLDLKVSENLSHQYFESLSHFLPPNAASGLLQCL